MRNKEGAQKWLSTGESELEGTSRRILSEKANFQFEYSQMPRN